MKMFGKLLVWFCVATVLAQVVILGMAFVKGNLKSDHIAQTIALLNGIDITGQRLHNVWAKAKEVPVPTREEVVEARAAMAKELDDRAMALQRERTLLDEMRKQLEMEKKLFDDRRIAFDTKLDELSKGLQNTSLGEVQRTLEALPPDQSKDQFLRMWGNDQKKEVVSILKGMPIDKRKKVMSEFEGEEERLILNEMLEMFLDGEPTASLIESGRSATDPSRQGTAPGAPAS
jgi:predicted nuclease with TOPRIM domain